MFTIALNDLMASVFFTVSSITRFILKARTGSRAPACVLRAAAAALRIRPSLVPPPVTRSGTERSLCSRSPRTLLSLVWISQPSPTLFFFFFFLAPARLLLLFFWDYIFFWWFFNSNSMHRKWVNCTRNMVSFVFYIPERNHSSSPPPAAAAAILSSNTVHCLLTFFSFLSLKPQFVNRGRAQKVSALLFHSVYIYYNKVIEYLGGGQFVNSHTVRLFEDGKHECSMRTCSL